MLSMEDARLQNWTAFAGIASTSSDAIVRLGHD